MKVICINATPRRKESGGMSKMNGLKEGTTYTVVESLRDAYGIESYVLAEVKALCNDMGAYCASRFIPCSEIDETNVHSSLGVEVKQTIAK